MTHSRPCTTCSHHVEAATGNMFPDNDLMTAEDVSQMLSISPKQLSKLIQNDELPAFFEEGEQRFRRPDVMAWLERFRVESPR